VSSFHVQNGCTLPAFAERATFSKVGDVLGWTGGEALAECATALGRSFRQLTASELDGWIDVLAEKEART
jgi:hypothetical protein